MIRAASAALLCAWAAPALALDLPPHARVSRETQSEFSTLDVPVSAWSEDGMQTIGATGTVTRRAWRIPETSLTTLQTADPIRQGLEDLGFDVLFDCSDRVCGGFDFRYALTLLPEPEMHVNLGDFRYFAARLQETGEVVSIVVSRGAGDVFVHETRVGKSTPAPDIEEPADEAQIAADADPQTPGTPIVASRNGNTLTERLEADGHVVLNDLEFAEGSSALEPRAFKSLAELAAWLRDTPDASIMLVGHSDATGALEANIALSRKRAQSVVDRLILEHETAPEQLRAEGIGFLAPIASNATPEGRAANRRVEVIFADPG